MRIFLLGILLFTALNSNSIASEDDFGAFASEPSVRFVGKRDIILLEDFESALPER